MDNKQQANDVITGWIVVLKNGDTAYVGGTKEDEHGALTKVMIRRPNPNGVTWMTHWLSAATWHKRFDRKVGETEPCIKCGSVPTACIPLEHETDDTGVLCQFSCQFCGHTWEAWVDDDVSP